MSHPNDALDLARSRRSDVEVIVVTLLRIAVGWHFAYEGLAKLLAGNWTSAGYLASASGIGAEAFHSMAANPAVLRVVDLLNMWGLLLIGMALMLGCATRWCEDPEQTIAFMRELKQPWIAFKVLAAGSIHPRAGFQYAFENGADFVCAGMYDFQVVEDANLALSILSGQLNRERPWRA